MSIPATTHPSIAATSLASPICSSSYTKRKELLHQLGTSSDKLHKTFRYDAFTLANIYGLLALGVLPCPLACGALFDGGYTCTLRAPDTHIARGSCRAHRLGSLPLPREMDRPYMPTTTRGITAALKSVASEARGDPSSAPLNTAAITLCQAHPEFTAKHMKTSRAQSAAALPALALTMLLPVVTNLIERSAYLTRGIQLRDDAQEALLPFPALVLGPHRLGATSSSVKTEVDARLDLWRRSLLNE
jgi:hypothetical protein